MAKTVRYKLYAMRPEKADTVANTERFTRVTAGYALLYTAKRKPKDSVEVDDLKRMTEADVNWLYQCNMTLLREYAEKHEEEVGIAMGSFFERLEKELKEEQEKMREEADHDTAGSEQQQQ